MKWCEAYIQMKENNAFVRRSVWGTNYVLWLKPEFLIQEDWCKDENLKKLISKYGHKNDKGINVIKGVATLSLFNGHYVESGWILRQEDKVADDWMIVNL